MVFVAPEAAIEYSPFLPLLCGSGRAVFTEGRSDALGWNFLHHVVVSLAVALRAELLARHYYIRCVLALPRGAVAVLAVHMQVRCVFVGTASEPTIGNVHRSDGGHRFAVRNGVALRACRQKLSAARFVGWRISR